ncbi:hypothetical protein HMPREF0731_0409, partial [Pseudoroseomonas cervicalis ATCC 49957]
MCFLSAARGPRLRRKSGAARRGCPAGESRGRDRRRKRPRAGRSGPVCRAAVGGLSRRRRSPGSRDPGAA